MIRSKPLQSTGFKSTAPGVLRLTGQSNRVCTICKLHPTPNAMASVCSVKCAIKKGKLDKAAAKKDLAQRKEAIKTRSDHMKEAQVAFNAYVRARDAGKLCICCDKPLTVEAIGGGFDCGHYRSVGSAPHMRFDERNAHGQTKQCNRYGAGRAVDYRIGLIKRIGLEAVEALESDQTPRKWTIEELKHIKVTYKAKLRILNNG